MRSTLTSILVALLLLPAASGCTKTETATVTGVVLTKEGKMAIALKLDSGAEVVALPDKPMQATGGARLKILKNSGEEYWRVAQ